MNITKRIKQIMLDDKISTTQLNEMLNKKNSTNYTSQNLSKKLNKDDLKFSDALDILDTLGYKIDIVEKDHEVNDIFKNKDYTPKPSEQIEMQFINWDKTIIDEIESTVHNKMDKIIKEIISSSAKNYVDKLINDVECNNIKFEIKSSLINDEDKSE